MAQPLFFRFSWPQVLVFGVQVAHFHQISSPTVNSWINMAVDHSLELADGSNDDDGQLRTGNKLSGLMCRLPFFLLSFNPILNLLPVGNSTRNLEEWCRPYNYCCYRLWSLIFGMEYCTAWMDSRTSFLALFCNRHLCLFFPSC